MTRWHRLLGIVSGIIVILTTLTGIALNHTDDLRLGRRHVESRAINARYQRVPPAVEEGFRVGEQWLLQVGSRIYLDDRNIHASPAKLNGAVRVGEGLFVLFADQLVEFDASGQMVDSFGALDGLKLPLTRIASSADGVVVESAGQPMLLDVARGAWLARSASDPPAWQQHQSPPAEAVETVVKGFAGGGVSYERVLLDLHSGRFFGLPGVVIVDAAALAVLLLALTGVYMWFKFKRPTGNGGRSKGRRPPP